MGKCDNYGLRCDIIGLLYAILRGITSQIIIIFTLFVSVQPCALHLIIPMLTTLFCGSSGTSKHLT
jgi:hypothetical protein